MRFDYGPPGNQRKGGKRPAPLNRSTGQGRIKPGTGYKGQISIGRCPECKAWGTLAIKKNEDKRRIHCGACEWSRGLPSTNWGRLYVLSPWDCIKCEMPLIKVMKGAYDCGSILCPRHGFGAKGKKKRQD